MRLQFSTTLLAAVTGLSALALPLVGHTATVGYYGNCGGGGSHALAISAAGHTPVAVADTTATTLATLDALMQDNCGAFPLDVAAVDAAVSNGMVLMVHDWRNASTHLPGGGSIVLTTNLRFDVDLPAGSPIANGPGGAVSNTSMDSYLPPYYYTNRGYAAPASLPAGSTILATAADPSEIVAFSYAFGLGRVVYSSVPVSVFLIGGIGQVNDAEAAPGIQAYAANLIAWAVGPEFTTCAAEGFTGSKLTLCRQVCEIDQTPTRLLSLIRLYRTAYREDPPCAL